MFRPLIPYRIQRQAILVLLLGRDRLILHKANSASPPASAFSSAITESMTTMTTHSQIEVSGQSSLRLAVSGRETH